MKIALTEVLAGGRAIATVVHLTDPYDDELTLCSQYEDRRVAHRGTEQDVNCMTCLVRASQPSFEDRMARALGLPKEFLFAENKNDGADDR